MAEADSSPEAKISSAQLRKIKKPMIEKRRRERINESLSQVKCLVLDALNKNESRFNKMEKADILEMTVKHLKTMHKHQQHQDHPSISIANRYRAGFRECAEEVKRYLSSVNNINPDIHDRLMSHLDQVAQKSMVLIDSLDDSCSSSSVTPPASVMPAAAAASQGKSQFLPNNFTSTSSSNNNSFGASSTAPTTMIRAAVNSPKSSSSSINAAASGSASYPVQILSASSCSSPVPAAAAAVLSPVPSGTSMLPGLPVRTLSNETISIPVISANQLNISPSGIVTFVPQDFTNTPQGPTNNSGGLVIENDRISNQSFTQIRNISPVMIDRRHDSTSSLSVQTQLRNNNSSNNNNNNSSFSQAITTDINNNNNNNNSAIKCTNQRCSSPHNNNNNNSSSSSGVIPLYINTAATASQKQKHVEQKRTSIIPISSKQSSPRSADEVPSQKASLPAATTSSSSFIPCPPPPPTSTTPTSTLISFNSGNFTPLFSKQCYAIQAQKFQHPGEEPVWRPW